MEYFLRSLKNNWILFVFFSLIYFTVYFRTLFFGYVEDDYGLISLTFYEALDQTFNTHHFRPLMFFSYPLVNFFFEKSIFAHHLVNFSIQYLNSILAILIFSKKIGFQRSLIAILIWNLLPWSCFPIIWVSQRNDLLMTFFVLLSIYYVYINNIKISAFLSFLAFLSKVTSLFFPIYIIYKSYINKKSLISGTLSLFASLVCAWWGFSQYVEKNHISDLSFLLKLLNYLKNWIHGWFSIILPVPFFLNIFYLFIYLIFLISFIIFLRKNFQLNNSSKEFFFISFLLSLTTAINPEMRVVFLQSLFFLLFIFSSIISFKFSKSLFFAVIFFTIFVFSTNIFVQEKFNSTEFSGELSNAYMPGSSALYLNNYYPFLRNFFIDIKEYIKK